MTQRALTMPPETVPGAEALEERMSRLIHDLNNTLSTVVGFSELVIERPVLLEDRATTLRYLDAIRLAGREATQIVTRLQDLWWPAAPVEPPRMRLSGHPDEDGAVSLAPDGPAEIAPRSLTILLIDDDEGVRSAIAECLTADGHRVAVAEGGEAGLAKLRESVFDLVITDRAMPGMNGDLVATEVKRRSPGTAVIMLTGFGELMSSANALPAGIDLLVSKPLTLSDLRRALATFLR